MRRVGRLVLQCAHDHALDVIIADRARRAGPRFVDETVEATRNGPASPLRHGRRVHVEFRGDRDVVETLRAFEHDVRSLCPRVRRFRPTFPTDECLAFVDEIALIGPRERIIDRLDAWKESGITTMILGSTQPEALRLMAEIVL